MQRATRQPGLGIGQASFCSLTSRALPEWLMGVESAGPQKGAVRVGEVLPPVAGPPPAAAPADGGLAVAPNSGLLNTLRPGVASALAPALTAAPGVLLALLPTLAAPEGLGLPNGPALPAPSPGNGATASSRFHEASRRPCQPHCLRRQGCNPQILSSGHCRQRG